MRRALLQRQLDAAQVALTEAESRVLRAEAMAAFARIELALGLPDGDRSAALALQEALDERDAEVQR